MTPSPSCLWDETQRPPYPALKSDLEADFLIIGGGLTGLSLANYLARQAPRAKTVLIEARRIGFGASGRTGGVVMPGTAVDLLPGTEKAHLFLENFLKEEGIECELRLHGCWVVSRNEKKNPLTSLKWQDSGRLRPVKQVEGGDVHPGMLLSGLARRAEKKGVLIFENTPAAGLEISGKAAVRTPGGRIRAKNLVLATNAFQLENWEHGARFFALNTFALATEPVSKDLLEQAGWKDERPFYTSELPYLWGRVSRSGRIVMGSGLDRYRENPDERTALSLLDDLERRFHGLHPAFERVKITHRWWGPILMARDRNPRILQAGKDPGVFFIGGYAGHGVAASHLLAYHLARHLTGDPKALESLSWALKPPPKEGPPWLKKIKTKAVLWSYTSNLLRP